MSYLVDCSLLKLPKPYPPISKIRSKWIQKESKEKLSRLIKRIRMKKKKIKINSNSFRLIKSNLIPESTNCKRSHFHRARRFARIRISPGSGGSIFESAIGSRGNNGSFENRRVSSRLNSRMNLRNWRTRKKKEYEDDSGSSGCWTLRVT